jgi:PEP-CTERM motif
VKAIAATITFMGSDIVAPAVLSPLNATGTPIIGDGRVDFLNGTKLRSWQVPTEFNAWLSGLTSAQGIKSFNLWLQDGASNQAGMWGETIALANTFDPSIVAFASTGWTASVYTIGDEWGDWWKGRSLITYTATGPEYYLRQGSSATFGFTANIIGNAGATGPDYQMWVGAGNSPGLEDSIVGADYFQRAITASTVPEPATMTLLGLGLAGIAARRRRNKK